MDLSTLDASQPPDTQPVSQGAQRIRETRDATITSFELEHYLTGEHKIPYGTPGTRPAAGHAGRLFINSETKILQFDNGSAWDRILSLAGASAIGVGGVVVPGIVSFTDLLSFSYNSVLANNFIFIVHIQMVNASGIWRSRALVDGVAITPNEWIESITGSSSPTYIGYSLSTVASHTITLQAVGDGTVSNSLLIMFPIV